MKRGALFIREIVPKVPHQNAWGGGRRNQTILQVAQACLKCLGTRKPGVSRRFRTRKREFDSKCSIFMQIARFWAFWISKFVRNKRFKPRPNNSGSNWL